MTSTMCGPWAECRGRQGIGGRRMLYRQNARIGEGVRKNMSGDRTMAKGRGKRGGYGRCVRKHGL